MPAPKEVVDLVEKFERYIESYKSSQYNETQIRREFIGLKNQIRKKLIAK
jgi:hypothetical protein